MPRFGGSRSWTEAPHARYFPMGYRTDRLFHTLVVVGASLSACGGRSVHDGNTPASAGSAGEGSAGSAGARPTLAPSDCSDAAQYTCQDYTTWSGCHCDPAAPRSRADCADPLEFHCQAIKRGPFDPPESGLLVSGDLFVGCVCMAPALRPEDCSSPEAFLCARVQPDFADCHCEPGPCFNGPDCCCQSESPRFGCFLCPIAIK